MLMASGELLKRRSVLHSAHLVATGLPEEPLDLDIFVRNLRLLNLDQISDSPRVTRESFSDNAQVNQKDRVRHTEWALYRLFELWDKKKTNSQLGSLFPALVPLQSVKLRASLYRWIYDLKQEGVLCKECVIRKSTLDECKGEKFEELLMLFSSAVLRKVTKRRHESRRSIGASGNQNIGASLELLDSYENKILSPLILAHRISLSGFLKEKNRDKSRIQGMEQTLKSKETDVNLRLRKATTSLADLDQRSKKAGVDLKDVQSQVREHWPEGNAWLDSMLDVDNRDGRDPYLEESFSHVWDSSTTAAPLEYEDKNASLIAALQSRLDEQQGRLDQWRTFQSQLSARMQSFSQTPRKASARSVRPSPIKSPIKSPKKSPSKPAAGKRRVQSPQKPARNVLTAAEQSIAPVLSVDPTPSKSKGDIMSGSHVLTAYPLRESGRSESGPKGEIPLSAPHHHKTPIDTPPTEDGSLKHEPAKILHQTPMTDASYAITTQPTEAPSILATIPKTPTQLSLAERAQISLARAQSQRERAYSTPRDVRLAEGPKHASPTRADTSAATATATTAAAASTTPTASPAAPAASLDHPATLRALTTPIETPIRPLHMPPAAISSHRKAMSMSTSMSNFQAIAANSATARLPPVGSGVSTPVAYSSGVDVDDEDCASVFKSRPKLKTSPVGSPGNVSPVPWTGF